MAVISLTCASSHSPARGLRGYIKSASMACLFSPYLSYIAGVSVSSLAIAMPVPGKELIQILTHRIKTYP